MAVMFFGVVNKDIHFSIKGNGGYPGKDSRHEQPNMLSKVDTRESEIIGATESQRSAFLNLVTEASKDGASASIQ
jgi:hypothetical protein